MLEGRGVHSLDPQTQISWRCSDAEQIEEAYELFGNQRDGVKVGLAP
jgi:hypothetical protein